MTSNKIHPSVDALIKPIVHEMTKIYLTEKQNPVIGQHNEPPYIKEMKKACVHIVFEGNEFKIPHHRDENGKLICDACGREIATKFDNTAVDKITDCITVINQLLFFGMINGLKAEPINTLISLKKALPGVAQLMRELNEYIKREEATKDSERNIGAEYSSASRQILG